MTTRIGFIGAGLMGHGMARNIVEKGYPLCVLAHRNRGPVEDLLARGATEADSPAALAQRSDIVILCVPSSVEVELCVLGENGVLAGAHEGLIVIDCTTAEPASTERVAPALAAMNVRFADAPLTRSPKDAEAGRLNTLVGADAATFAAIRPVLETFSREHFPHRARRLRAQDEADQQLPEPGHCRAGGRGGDHRDQGGRGSPDDVRGGERRRRQLERVPALHALGARRGESGMVFKLKNGQKDIRYYTHLAEAVGSTAFLGEAVHQIYTLAAAQGESESYVPALARALGKVNGVKIGPLD